MIDGSKILIKAFLHKKSKYIPIWELEGNVGDYGFEYNVKGDFNSFSENSLVDVYYDINTKEINTGEIIEYKNKEKELPKIGSDVFYENLKHIIKKAKLIGIKWEVQFNYINMGEHIDREYNYYTKNIKLDYNKLYHIKIYEPRYIIEGEKHAIYPYAIKKVEL